MRIAVLAAWISLAVSALAGNYPIVGTAQAHRYDSAGELPLGSKAYPGQDADFPGPAPSYRNNGDGTITDLNTGLMWQKAPSGKVPFAEVADLAAACRLAGHADWRVPSIKELYSLINFEGYTQAQRPFIDTRFFDFRFGDESRGERMIDAQYWSSTQYIGLTMNGNRTVFGVNFADGRIKGYPRDIGPRGEPMRQFLRLVRGNPQYGVNQFVDNRDGTISDLATGLMWMKEDSRKAMNWKDALAWARSQKTAGHSDWRLPNAKELESIVDYTRAPDAADPAHRSPAIDAVFAISDPDAWFWSSTTHLDGPRPGNRAVYIAFGIAGGYMPDRRTGEYHLLNVHGAGAQRSDPKDGDPRQFPHGMGPQGDVIRIFNYARGVRFITP